jgi:hypothetical protein
MYLPTKSCTQKRRKALRKIVIPNGCLRGCRLTAADCGQRRSCQNANSLHDVSSPDLGNVKGLGMPGKCSNVLVENQYLSCVGKPSEINFLANLELCSGFWLTTPLRYRVITSSRAGNMNLCSIWWQSRQSVIRLASASSPRALRRLT